MKKTILILILAVSLATTMAVKADLPVIDPSVLIQSILEVQLTIQASLRSSFVKRAVIMSRATKGNDEISRASAGLGRGEPFCPANWNLTGQMLDKTCFRAM